MKHPKTIWICSRMSKLSHYDDLFVAPKNCVNYVDSFRICMRDREKCDAVPYYPHKKCKGKI
jgi:hypothetical protein